MREDAGLRLLPAVGTACSALGGSEWGSESIDAADEVGLTLIRDLALDGAEEEV